MLLPRLRAPLSSRRGSVRAVWHARSPRPDRRARPLHKRHPRPPFSTSSPPEEIAAELLRVLDCACCWGDIEARKALAARRAIMRAVLAVSQRALSHCKRLILILFSMRTERVSISAFVDPDDHERLVERARSEDRSVSAELRVAIREHLERVAVDCPPPRTRDSNGGSMSLRTTLGLIEERELEAGGLNTWSSHPPPSGVYLARPLSRSLSPRRASSHRHWPDLAAPRRSSRRVPHLRRGWWPSLCRGCDPEPGTSRLSANHCAAPITAR